ncbi:ABC transporter permease [Leucobacter sp. UCD-THU]|jgi:ribose transport system permease protein|uniref:ABC transporter permease n=1 Tax=Leucobacter sp. UCD-THU TaxID=1292023 RepID=UPI000377D59B|nr:ABC transporter permease [Leucobacter sp. UCD-THU]EYT51664.1 ABC transporter permease [Leucobacter sp. UCD-THU]
MNTRTVEPTGKKLAAPKGGLVQTIPYWAPVSVALVVLIVMTVIQSPAFFGSGSWQLVLLYASPLIMLAMAQAPVLMSGGGGLDLSVGPAAGLIAVIIGGIVMPQGVTSLPLLILIAVGCGLVNGALNGLLVAFLRVPPIIATLATYLIYGGLALQLLRSPVGVDTQTFGWFYRTTVGIPNMLLIIVVFALLWGLLMRTAYGRNLRAVGSNDRASYTAGINVTGVRFAAYVIAGLGTGIAGILLVIVLGGADATVGESYTLQAISAAVLGGVSLLGGRGGVVGAAIGGLLIFLIQNYLTATGAPSYVLQVAFGVVLIAAIVVNGGWEFLRTKGGRR